MKFYSFFLLISLGLCWGTSFSIAKFTVLSGINPISYAFWQNVGPAILVFFILFLKEKKLFHFSRSPVSLTSGSKNYFIFCFAAGFLGIFLPNLLQYFSAPHLPSGILGLIVNTSPLFTYVLSILFFVEEFSYKRLLSVLAAIFGMFFIFYPKSFSVLNMHWLFVALSIPFLLACTTVYTVKFRPKNKSSLHLASGMLIASCLFTVPLTFFTNHFVSISNIHFLPNLFIILEIILSSLGYVLFFELLRVAGPIYYSLVGCIVALSSLFWGYFLFHEKPTMLASIGILFVLIAVFTISYKKPTSS